MKKILSYLVDEEGIKDLLFIFIGLNIFVFLSFHYNFLSDDAFITFRYVKNFLRGWGPVYNKGEYIEGFTSPLWFLLLSAVAKAGVDIVAAGRYLGLLIGGAQVILFYYLLKKIKLDIVPRLTAFYFLTFSNVIAVWSLGGLETVAYSFLLLTCFYLLLSVKKWTETNLIALSFVTLLLALTRLEGLFVVLVTIITIRSKGEIIYYLAPLILVLGISFLVRFNLYHKLLPNTFYVKVGGGLPMYWRGIKYVLDFFWNYSCVLLFLILTIYGLVKKSKASFLSLVFIFFIISETVYVGGDGLPMYRFLLPVIPYFGVLLGLFINDKPALGLVIGAILILKTLMPPLSGNQYILYLEQKNYEVPRWTRVGKWLASHAGKNETAAMVPIGAVGYYSDLYIHDMMGLVDAHIANKKTVLGKGWAGHEKHDGPYILSKKPTYLLLGNIQVYDYRLDMSDPQFVKPSIKPIREREDDIFTEDLWKDYEKKIDAVGQGYHLHHLKLKGN
jgi:arabinofuranosyltransferase